MSEVKRFDVPSMRSLIQGEQAVMGYEVVLASDYDALAAEAQALREEVAALKHRQQVLIGSRNAHRDERDAARKEVAALRARVVVVPERDTGGSYYEEGWNACLDELARINGMTVSEGLVQGMAKFAREIICGALDGGSFDGADIQESAERHGLIAKQVMKEPCRGPEEYCACAWSTSFPAECYRVTPKLRALLNEDKENGDHAA